jgi:hypothetical protein
LLAKLDRLVGRASSGTDEERDVVEAVRVERLASRRDQSDTLLVGKVRGCSSKCA